MDDRTVEIIISYLSSINSNLERIAEMMEENERVKEVITQDTLRTTKFLASWEVSGLPQQSVEG